MQEANTKPVRSSLLRERIKFSVPVPLLATILLLLSIFMGAICNLQHKQITNEIPVRLNGISSFFNEQLSKNARLIDSIFQFLKNDLNLQNIWLAKEQAHLLNCATPLFENYSRGDIHMPFLVAKD